MVGARFVIGGNDAAVDVRFLGVLSRVRRTDNWPEFVYRNQALLQEKL